MAIASIEYNSKNFSISYDLFHSQKKRTLTILHGWGSNKEIMKSAFRDKFENFKTIFIDLPGFGKSGNDFVLDSYDYAKIIDLFLKQKNIQKDIILGHSFGGKIATLLNPNILVLLSSAGIVTKKSLKIRAKIKLFKLLKPFGFSNLYKIFASDDVKKMSQNMYESFKKIVDEDFENEFKSFDHVALIFWGIDDSATPLSSGQKISKLIKNSSFYPLEGDHYFFLKHSKFIEQKVIDAIY